MPSDLAVHRGHKGRPIPDDLLSHEIYATAIHESSHAVIRLHHFKLPVLKLVLSDGGYSFCRMPAGKYSAYTRAIVALAGPVAEAKINGRYDPTACQDDLETARESLALMPRPVSMERAAAHALELVERNWEAIRLVALAWRRAAS
jgi:hypothetical protein